MRNGKSLLTLLLLGWASKTRPEYMHKGLDQSTCTKVIWMWFVHVVHRVCVCKVECLFSLQGATSSNEYHFLKSQLRLYSKICKVYNVGVEWCHLKAPVLVWTSLAPSSNELVLPFVFRVTMLGLLKPWIVKIIATWPSRRPCNVPKTQA